MTGVARGTLGRRSAGRENGRSKGPGAIDEQSSHRRITLWTKQCPSTLGTRAFRASGGDGGGRGTYLVLGQGFQVLQDLSHHRLAQLVVLSQKLGVSPVQAVIGVN